MKRLLFLLGFVALLTTRTQAQANWIYWKYKDYDGSISFSVPGFLPKIASIFVKGKEERRLVRRTGKIRVMVFEGGNPITSKDYSRLIRHASNPGGMEELITVREGKTRVNILVKENGKRIRKLVVMVQEGEDGEFVMVSIKGRFKYSDLNAIIKKYQEKAMDEKSKDGEPSEKMPVKIPVRVKI